MKHSKLVSSMLESAKFRGHDMIQTDIHNIGLRVLSFWACKECGMWAMVDTHPQPNSIDISGDSMAENCKGDKMKSESFQVVKPEGLLESEEQTVLNQEGLWFYHSYYRTEWELTLLAHEILLSTGEHNYERTSEYKLIESISKQIDNSNSEPEKVRVNCPFTGKFEWIAMSEVDFDDLIYTLSDYLTEAHGIDDYTVCYMEGEWGLWPIGMDY